jgi:hypothetical protein
MTLDQMLMIMFFDRLNSSKKKNYISCQNDGEIHDGRKTQICYNSVSFDLNQLKFWVLKDN